ncbi:hypothetical protein [Isoptericola cucumis]|uniref:Uncharacterized protein n=1 Tax=Isoptericola cucumis TaxID=1776856 RepID=A0ABQ2B9Q5_9MICO|nr:hypothetical protein [Isoptericola cucumis]GGI09980.1 hypothetical protein GCM10007368_28960 [Isoptericola cucumis]
MRTTTRHRTIRTSVAGAVVSLVGLVSLGLGGTSAAAAPDGDGTPVQVEAVTSEKPVMVEDLKISAAAARSTYYCAVRDGTFGCKNAKPGTGLVVARLYQHKDFGGFQVVVFNPAYRVGCSGGTGDNEGGANLGSALSNRVSSVKTYNSCDVKLYNGNNKTGATSGFIHRDNLLAFNDRANSFRIS